MGRFEKPFQTLQPNFKLSQEIQGFSTDSRHIRPGEIFVAISGEKFDGHDFVAEISTQGALGAIVSKSAILKDSDKIPSGFPLFQVENTTEALRTIAAAYRKALTIPIIAVGGSNGKTTTKEWIAHLLANKLENSQKVYKTAKSLNSILGIALSILSIRDEEVAVIEIGIDEPGWMDQHLAVVQPTHGILTTIAEEHLNRLSNIETVAKEELKLFQFLIQKTAGHFAANIDSPYIAKAISEEKIISDRLITYGLDGKAMIEGRYLAPHRLHSFGVEWQNPLPGKHNAQNLLAAISMLRLLYPSITRAELMRISESTQNFKGEAHRSRWINSKNDVRIFDDCYNANPSSMEASLQTFIELTDGCHQHVVLGDMLDLGSASDDAHRRILNVVSVLNFDHIYLFGPEFRKAYDGMIRKPENISCFLEMEMLIATLKKNLNAGHTVFLKGSRGMALERVLKPFEA